MYGSERALPVAARNKGMRESVAERKEKAGTRRLPPWADAGKAGGKLAVNPDEMWRCCSVERIYKGSGTGYNVSGSALISPTGLEINGRKRLADIRPFRGTFYNQRVVESLSRTIAPPYDVIDEKKKRALLARSPYNIVRLILPPLDGGRDFWNQSATLFQAWKKGDVMSVDGASSYYLYRQVFELPGENAVSRTGILALLRCRDFSGGEVLPHEKTFPRTRVERLNLLRACRANFSQIFTVFRDEGEEILDVIEEVTSGAPFLDLNDDEGVIHQLWRIEEGGVSRTLTEEMLGRRLMIADGHHRYETALDYSREGHSSAEAAQAAAYVSVVMFRSEDPGLVVLPVHRLLRRFPLQTRDAYQRLERFFNVEVIQEGLAERAGMFGERLASQTRPSFVMITPESAALLVLREGVEIETILPGLESARWKSLDVPILHLLVLTQCLGLDAAGLADGGDIQFTPWESAAMSALASGEAEAAFLVRPTSMDEIWEIAEGGERMPHKSSYFYPKLASGLVIYDHETALS